MALVVQSFGKEYEYKRAILVIVSYYTCVQNTDALNTILFTDSPDYFNPYLRDFPVQYILLTPEKIKNMRGEIDFLHRMKIALIEEAFEKTSGNLLYADSDTFFVADPGSLMNTVSPAVALMHLREYRFGALLNMQNPFRMFGELISGTSFKKANGDIMTVSLDQYSWNAGVMMLHATHARLLADVYTLTEQFYVPTRHHASEQFAFSVVLQNAVNLQSCEEAIYHYWYRVKKKIMDSLLEHELQLSWCDLSKEKKLMHIRKLTAMLPEYLENHILMIRDQAIQSFHENRFKQGYGFALRALLKDPFNLKFCRDLLYHIRRHLFGK